MTAGERAGQDVDRCGTLYVVGTPIGNLEDLTPRAVATLGSCTVIACEDTRVSRALLARHGIKARTISYHRFNETARAGKLLEVMRGGGSVALVTDGGTPGISDPGAILVRRARQEGHRVVPIPGASAVTALLSASGFPSGPFTFIGFLPRRPGERRRAIEAMRDEPRPLVLFESPQRIVRALDELIAALGDREGCLGREMTKLHEEFLCGPLSEIRAALSGRSVKGEIALLVAGVEDSTKAAASRRPQPAPEAPLAAVDRLIAEGWDRKEALRQVARDRGISRRDLYQELVRARRGSTR